MKLIKESINRLNDYVVPQEQGLVKLNQNESPFDIPYEVKESILDRLGLLSWNRYPPGFPENLVEHLSAYTGFPSSGILTGNGSNELIQTIFASTSRQGEILLTVSPGFSIYKRMASILEMEIVEISLKENFEFDFEKLIKEASRARLVFLSSPNNPTGTVISHEAIREIAKKTQGLIVIDEAYYEFYGQSAQSLIKEFPNLVVLRTFSKAFGAAGIRLGYLLGNDQVVNGLSKTRLPFSVGLFQQLAGEELLKRPDIIESTVKKIKKERQLLFHTLKKIQDLKVVPSQANFLLFECEKMEGKDFFRKLYQSGILTRYFDHPLLNHMLRITVGKPEENKFFLEATKKILEDER